MAPEVILSGPGLSPLFGPSGPKVRNVKRLTLVQWLPDWGRGGGWLPPVDVDVAVQFYPWFIPLFFFMLINDNEYETKENKN